MKRGWAGSIAVFGVAFVLFGASPALADTYGPTAQALGSPNTVIVQGGNLALSWTGFAPDELVANEAHSTPVALPTIRADSTGAFSETVAIPASLQPGAHEVVATGLTSGKVATFAFTITGSAAAGGGGATTGSGSSTGGGSSSAGGGGNTFGGGGGNTFAFTGANVERLCGIGAVALAAGGCLILASRKRRHHHRSV